jgi:hypothetical protein
MTHLRHQDGLKAHYLLALVPAQPRIGSFPSLLDKSEPPRITPPPLRTAGCDTTHKERVLDIHSLRHSFATIAKRVKISAEEEGFEPTVAFRLRRFSNSDPPSAMGCTERKSRENEGPQTKILAPNGTERHRDQNSDQSADHETKEKFGHEPAAERLLAAVADGLPAVADGLPESVERARELVAAVLGDSIVRRAVRRLLLVLEPPLAASGCRMACGSQPSGIVAESGPGPTDSRCRHADLG